MTENSTAGIRKKILIIEDEWGVAEILIRVFVSAGYEVLTAQDVIGGVNEAYDFKPDLIVLDLMFPGGGGLSFMEHLNRSAHTQGIPIVVLTGMRDEDYKKKVLAAGVKAFIEKPPKIENLLSEIKKILEQGRNKEIEA